MVSCGRHCLSIAGSQTSSTRPAHSAPSRVRDPALTTTPSVDPKCDLEHSKSSHLVNIHTAGYVRHIANHDSTLERCRNLRRERRIPKSPRNLRMALMRNLLQRLVFETALPTSHGMIDRLQTLPYLADSYTQDMVRMHHVDRRRRRVHSSNAQSLPRSGYHRRHLLHPRLGALRHVPRCNNDTVHHDSEEVNRVPAPPCRGPLLRLFLGLGLAHTERHASVRCPPHRTMAC